MQDFTLYKILNAIKYFVKQTQNVGRTKIFKLLYFWDFMYFKKYGLSITGYQYFTFPFGPVPLELYNQITNDQLPELFKNEIKIVENQNEEENNEFKQFKIVLKSKKINLDWLAPNEKEMLELVAEIFKYAFAKEMTEITHLHKSPWSTTIKKYGMGKPIDIRLALDNESTLDPETIDEYLNLQKDVYFNGRF